MIRTTASLLRERLELAITDENPDTTTFHIRDGQETIGTITLSSNISNLKDSMEIVALDIKEGLDKVAYSKRILHVIWRHFKSINTLLIAPKPYSQLFWDRMGAHRLNSTFLMIQKGH
jgi:hypothetical protein